MRARGDLRHHAAVAPVLLPLRAHDVGRMRPRPSAAARTTAAAVSSQLVSMPSTSVSAASSVWLAWAPLASSFAPAGAGHKRRPLDVVHRLAPRERHLQAAKIRIGTRGSPLALAQAREVRRAWRRRTAPAARLRDRVIKTTGDRIQDRPLIEAGGKGLFTKEIEEALLAGDIDLAVHSMKDMPTVLPRGARPSPAACRARMCATPSSAARQPASPALPAGRRGRHLVAAPAGAGAGALRPDLASSPMRGNVETRLRKLAGGRRRRDAARLRRPQAAGAGATASPRRCRSRRCCPRWRRAPSASRPAPTTLRRRELLAPLNHQPTALVRHRRARVPGQARRLLPHADRRPRRARGGRLRFRGVILTPDGAQCHAAARGPARGGHHDSARTPPRSCCAKAGPDFFRALRPDAPARHPPRA